MHMELPSEVCFQITYDFGKTEEQRKLSLRSEERPPNK